MVILVLTTCVTLVVGGDSIAIVNVSSMGAYHYAGGAAALGSVTKAAVNRMTEALAVEWARYGINAKGSHRGHSPRR